MASPLAARHRERLSTRDRVWPDTLRAYQVAWRQWFRPDSTGSDAGKAAPLRAPSGGSVQAGHVLVDQMQACFVGKKRVVPDGIHRYQTSVCHRYL